MGAWNGFSKSFSKSTKIRSFVRSEDSTSESRVSNENDSGLIIPTFKEEWEDEYVDSSFQPHTIRAVCVIGAVYFFFDFLYETFGNNGDGTGGNFLWSFFTQFSHLLCSIVYYFTVILLSSRLLRRFCVRNYNSICAFQIIFTYLAVIASRVMLEIRRDLFQRATYPQVHWGIDYSVFLPLRKCNDSNPIKSYTLMSFGDDDTTSIGCENTILGGGMLSTYIFLNLIPVMYHMSAKSAAFVCFSNCMIIIIALLGTGTRGSTLWSFVTFQVVAGISSVYFCHNHDIISRRQYCIIKATKFASEQNGNLLYTLIPKNVVTKLATHTGKEMLGTSISRCTVMFCSLEPHEELRVLSEDVFELLNEVFSEFDQAVQRYGMFKYQHVSEWYIVACPRAACPFDENEQSKPYPMQNTMSMIFLAEELCSIAKKYRVGEHQLWLKVGINCGPVAGAVIGSHRSFYCLYGDTINTAARMCKIADSKIHCTSAFHQIVTNTCSALISSEFRGVKEVKGKGTMEVFDISVNQSYYTVARAFRGSESGDLLSMSEMRIISPRTSWVTAILYVPFVERIMENLSQEAYLWVNDPKHKIDHTWIKFEDSEYEGKFVEAQSLSMREGLLAGLAVHLCSFACQWNLATYPEYVYDFEAIGAPELAVATHSVLVTLSVHWGVLSTYCILLIVLMWKFPQYAKVCHSRYVLIKVVHMAISILTFTELPALWGLMLSFSFEMICLHGAMSTLSFRLSLALVGTTFIAFATALSVVHGCAPYTICKAFGYAMGSIFLSRIANYNLRFRWRLNNLFEAELHRLREKLSDLLPPRIAKAMIEKSKRLPCESSEAAVLQLDICGFTAMSQELSPLEVAQMVHRLFSAFDAAVQASGLFKMDTVGDAYLVAGLLPPYSDAEQSTTCETLRDILAAQKRAQVCEEMLKVARAMIDAVEVYRLETGRAVRCRIGVSVGPVLTGVLGVLQPRFHMYGPGMRSAEVLEQSGVPGAVHASAAFARALRGIDTPCCRQPATGGGGVWSPTPSIDPVSDVRKSPQKVCHASGDDSGSWWVGVPEFVYMPTNLAAQDEDSAGGGDSTSAEGTPGVDVRDGAGHDIKARAASVPAVKPARFYRRSGASAAVGKDSAGVGSTALTDGEWVADDDDDDDVWGRHGWTVLWSLEHVGCDCPPTVPGEGPLSPPPPPPPSAEGEDIRQDDVRISVEDADSAASVAATAMETFLGALLGGRALGGNGGGRRDSTRQAPAGGGGGHRRNGWWSSFASGRSDRPWSGRCLVGGAGSESGTGERREVARYKSGSAQSAKRGDGGSPRSRGQGPDQRWSDELSDASRRPQVPAGGSAGGGNGGTSHGSCQSVEAGDDKEIDGGAGWRGRNDSSEALLAARGGAADGASAPCRTFVLLPKPWAQPPPAAASLRRPSRPEAGGVPVAHSTWW